MDSQERQLSSKSGEILKKAREGQGIALETVHEMTKIPLDALKAIEDGYKVRTLTPFYMKGFVKMYAQYLGVDLNLVLEDYHREELPAKLSAETPEVDIPLKLDKVFTKQRQQQIVQGVAVLVALFLVSRVVGCVKGHWSASRTETALPAESTPAPSMEAKATPAAKIDPVPEPPVVKPAPPPKPEPAPVAVPSPTPVPEAKRVSLTVKANKSGWLQVKVDGNLVFQSILDKGVSETWQADREIEISGKNIHNLDYEVNGDTLGALGRADRSARRIVVTKDGLTVKK